MKTKIALLTLGLITTFFSYAQMGRPSFGLRAGVNFQNLNGKDADDNKRENDLTVGFNVGVNAEIPVAEDFYLQPGVLYSTKGAQMDDDGDVKVNIGYIEVPVNLVYKPELGTGRLLMGFGPYVAFGINGKVKGDGMSDRDIKFENEVSPQDFLGNSYYLKRLDAGANLLFGYEFTSRLSAQLNAQLGLVNIHPKISGSTADLGTLKNTGFGVSLGYRF